MEAVGMGAVAREEVYFIFTQQLNKIRNLKDLLTASNHEMKSSVIFCGNIYKHKGLLHKLPDKHG